MPTLRIDTLHFAARHALRDACCATRRSTGEQVLPPEVAQTRAPRAGAGGRGRHRQAPERRIHAQRTAARSWSAARPAPATIASKPTARAGVLLSSRVVSRSGTFVFYIGERHFGTLTAYVHGPGRREVRASPAPCRCRFSRRWPRNCATRSIAKRAWAPVVPQMPRCGSNCPRCRRRLHRQRCRRPSSNPMSRSNPAAVDKPRDAHKKKSAAKKADQTSEPLDTVPATTPAEPSPPDQSKSPEPGTAEPTGK